MQIRRASFVTTAIIVAALSSTARGQSLPLTRTTIKLQVVPLDTTRFVNGVMQLSAGQRASLELRAVDGTGKALDLKSTAVTWQSGNGSILSVQAAGFRATAGGGAPGQTTLTVAALGQTALVQTAVAAKTTTTTAAPTLAGGATPLVAPPPTIGNPCSTGTPSPLLGQPCVRSVTDSAALLMNVYVKGTGFTGTSVAAAGASASVSNDSLILVIPKSGTPPTTVSVVVTNPKTGRTSSGSFKLIPTRVVSFWPKDGRQGDRIAIQGYGFQTPNAGTMFANGHNPGVAETVDGTGTLVNVLVPSGDATGHLWVSNAVSTDEFVELASIDPMSDQTIPPNGSITFTGKALQNITAVTLNTAPLTIGTKTYNQLNVALPAAFLQTTSTYNYGPVTFTYRTASGTNQITGPKITVMVQPQITSITPDSGAQCDQAIVHGKALINAPLGATATPSVQFDANPSPSAWGSNTDVYFIVPKLAATGPVTVIGYNHQPVTSSTNFRVIPPLPSADYQGGGSIAQAGMKVQFTGRLLEVTKISFTGGVDLTTGWTVAPGFNNCIDLLTVTIPTGAKTGNVTFTNPRGSATASLYIAP